MDGFGKVFHKILVFGKVNVLVSLVIHMKFEVRHAGPTPNEKELIEINTLEDLRKYALKVNESLIIKFQGVTSNAWYPYGKRGSSRSEIADIEKLSEEQYITIYDNYLE